MLAGQIADAIATLFIAYFSDKTNTKIGKRIPWYLFGIFIVTVSFLPIFLPLVKVTTPPDWQDYLYYISFPSLFNVGWAAVQISHMSLVPSLTCSRKRRDLLNGLRSTFSFSANIFVLVTALIFFQFLSSEFSYTLLAIVNFLFKK
jgi:Na+/melibiose symporter-like transporter